MNNQFRDYVFGTAFNLCLTRAQLDQLVALVKNPEEPHFGKGGAVAGLFRRGLVYWDNANAPRCLYRPTKAGLLVYDLLTEAGEQAALDDECRLKIETMSELQKEASKLRDEVELERLHESIRKSIQEKAEQNKRAEAPLKVWR